MNLSQLLATVGMNRDSYNTLKKQDRVPFMERDVEGLTNHDRYSEAHALALLAFMELRDAGLSPAVAGSAVHDSFRDIKAITQGHEPSSTRCGIRKNHLGVFDTYGHRRKDTDPMRLVSEAYTNLPEIWIWLQQQLSAA